MVTIFFLYCGGKAAATEDEKLTMESADSNNLKLTRQGVHAMFSVAAQTAESESDELFPETLEIG